MCAAPFAVFFVCCMFVVCRLVVIEMTTAAAAATAAAAPVPDCLCVVYLACVCVCRELAACLNNPWSPHLGWLLLSLLFCFGIADLRNATIPGDLHHKHKSIAARPVVEAKWIR